MVYDVIAFQPKSITAKGQEDVFPQFWALLTCTMFESNLFFLCMNLLLINYFIGQLE